MIKKIAKKFLKKLFFISNKTLNMSNLISLFDAGSTSTRLHIYSFVGDKLCKKGCFFHYEPLGIDTVERTLTNLLQNITSDIPVSFYATAGLREDKYSEEILKIVEKHMSNYNLVEIRLLTGEEEAIGLVDAFEYFFPEIENYLLMDMGGKSTQIVYKENGNKKFEVIETGISSKKKFKEESANSKVEFIDNKHNITDNSYNFNITDNSNNLIKELHAFSAFSDSLEQFNGKTLGEIKQIKNDACKEALKCHLRNITDNKIINNITDKNKICQDCDDMNFVIGFLESSKIHENTIIRSFKHVDDLYLSWPVGRALYLRNILREKNIN
ncbi:hypothetical protein EHP00_1839 [Ecytonucleospora hepatopenaei]|uniref:Uncharacterized protein n=1 Tax=Ecytonucleospora hepatopenaei TaxID=646526 RepID=A0A1W0E589_9MICR|nr:hypothetical protein EHP00_1839 [Ecytonucleospora hepatopenaei]